MTHPQQQQQEQAVVDAWNAAHPVGTSVRYWPGLREGLGEQAYTRTAASVLSGHTAVVWVTDHSGCIALTHVEATPVGEAWEIAAREAQRAIVKAAGWWRDNQPNPIVEPAGPDRSLKQAVDHYREVIRAY